MVQSKPRSKDLITLEFRVTDTGVGMNEEQIGNLFQAFAQADSSMTRRFGGTGLGLYLARLLAQKLGGDLRLEESRLGHGSSFIITIDAEPVKGETFRLPREIDKTASLKDESNGHGKEFGLLSGIKVLLVDDCADIRFLVDHYLKQTGVVSAVAKNGLEAVQAARRDKFEVILMDLQMPSMDGFAALVELKKNGYNGKIVAVTAHAMKGEREKCLEAGFDDYVSKPIEWNMLYEVIYRNARWHS